MKIQVIIINPSSIAKHTQTDNKDCHYITTILLIVSLIFNVVFSIGRYCLEAIVIL